MSFQVERMTFDVFDAQASLLYAEAPDLDFEQFVEQAADWCAAACLSESYAALPDVSSGASRCFVGNGFHIWITVAHEPIDAVAFALPLRSPLLKYKNFDFQDAIDTHHSVVQITVGDGETPALPNSSQPADDAAGTRSAQPFAKMSALQMTMQILAQAHPPLMADFGPSQLLLTPHDIAAVADQHLPVPILIHPFPFRQKTADGGMRRGMAAIHAQRLIGAELELEAIPAEMPIKARINTLSQLVKLKMEDIVSLSHGDSLETDEGQMVWIRHEEGSIENGPPRIVVSFNEPTPVQTAPQSQQSFHDRVAKLKNNSSTGTQNDMPAAEKLPEDAQVFQESEEELRARVQATISPDLGRTKSGRRFGSPVYLLMLAVVGGYFFLTNSEEQIETLAKAFGDPLSKDQSQPQRVAPSALNGAPAPQPGTFGKTVPATGQAN